MTAGVLPSGWRWVRLGDVCQISARQVDPKTPEFGSLSHVNGENIEGGKCRLLYLRTAAEEGMTSGKYLFEPGDVLYSKLRPYLRKAVVVDFRGVCSADMYPIRVNQAMLDPHYAVWMLVTDEFTSYADRESGRARMPKLNREQLFAWQAPLPPLSEQQRIAAVLQDQMAAVEQARAAADARLEAANALGAAYLRVIFSAQNVKKWSVVPLGGVGDIVSGVTLGRTLRNGQTRQVPYLRVANVKDGHLDLADVYTIEATTDEIETLALSRGDLLLTEGGDADKLGRGTCWQEELPECIHQNHIFRVRFDQRRFFPGFVSSQMGSPYGKSYFLAHAKHTTGIATINQKVLRAFPLLAPPIEEQFRIANWLREQVKSAKEVRRVIQEEYAAIQAVPTALLRGAFKGEL
jgi:type I restriction enzyme S subunit